MTNEEFEIAFKQAIANVGDYSNMTLYDPKNPLLNIIQFSLQLGYSLFVHSLHHLLILLLLSFS